MYCIAVITPDTHTFKQFENSIYGTDIKFRHIRDLESCRGVTYVGHIMLRGAIYMKDFNKVMECIKQRTINLKP